jgi:hypothetical protein
VPRLIRLLALGAAAFAVAAGSVAGCGGDSNDGSGPDDRKPPASAEVPPPRLPASDRRAYATIQKASGDLRAAATPIVYGTGGRIASEELSADVRKLQRLAPRSRLLRNLRDRTLSAVQSAMGGNATKEIAAAAIAEADRIDDGLRRYAATNPAANEITPG